MNHIAWHAGSRTVNRKSVGVEISNAYYPKYQSWYKKNGFGERPSINLGIRRMALEKGRWLKGLLFMVSQ
jgi:hypothetical protein